MKKIICLLLSVVMLISAVAGISITAYAESGTCGNGVNWEFNPATETLSITGSGEMNDFQNIDDSPWKECRNGIKNLVIADGITKIGSYAFTFCSNLKEVTIPKSVAVMGNQVFYMCTGIEKVTIYGEIKEIKGSMFRQCRSMKSITIPASVTKIGKNAFNQCLSLKDVYFCGTQAQWNAVEIGSENDGLSSATIHYGEPVSQPDVNPTQPANQTTQQTATTAAPAKISKPKATSISKLTAGKKQFKATWKKISGVTGYQVQYSTDKKFKKGNKTVTVKGVKKTSTTVKKLKSKKTYYVRVRTYKTSGKTKVYSAWSKAKTVKIK